MANKNQGKNQGPKTQGEDQKKVTVSQKALEDLIAKVEKTDELLDRIKRLEDTGDAGRLENFDAKRRQIGPRRYRLSTYQGKIITGWRTVEDREWKDPISNRMMHVQRYEILMEDNTKEEIAGYENFASTLYNEKILGEKVRETQETDGAVTLTVKIIEKDHPRYGEEILIDQTYVN